MFPIVAGNFIGQVLLFIGLFILMGMGLNLEIGLAGLAGSGLCRILRSRCVHLCSADRGQSRMRSTSGLIGSLNSTSGQAAAAAVVMSTLVGVLFGVPVLRIRGDYLAVATLGLGEIVRVLVLSDFRLSHCWLGHKVCSTSHLPIWPRPAWVRCRSTIRLSFITLRWRPQG